ncbi:(S)-2-haloacid dehalogenase 2 [Apiospora phragmitis]|uniref:(S)-2-haloacid dehalogenase 2 n=1 Tax=Apiospora phragmitis TaxID=2905665 RepID=A0ABR1VG18_9PEZI
MPAAKPVIAFDLYGTLLSTESIAHELAKLYGEQMSKTLAALWRQYQLEYTWRINCMGQYRPFNEITHSALKHALADHALQITERDTNELMKAYDRLHIFPEVSAALELLKEKGDQVDVYVFSNGTDAMVGNSIKSSPDLGPHAGLFKSLVTVEDVKAYKPDMKVYAHLVKQVGKEKSNDDVWVVSANPFDIVGTRAAGLKAAFIDRPSKGWIDRLDENSQPTIVASGGRGSRENDPFHSQQLVMNLIDFSIWLVDHRI